MFFKASFLQSAELQLIRKDQDFNLFSICRSKKNLFHCKEKWTFVFDNKLLLSDLLDAL